MVYPDLVAHDMSSGIVHYIRRDIFGNSCLKMYLSDIAVFPFFVFEDGKGYLPVFYEKECAKKIQRSKFQYYPDERQFELLGADIGCIFPEVVNAEY